MSLHLFNRPWTLFNTQTHYRLPPSGRAINQPVQKPDTVSFGNREPVTPETVPSVGLPKTVEKRHTPQSGRSHYEGSGEELLALVSKYWSQRKVSPNDSRVLYIPITGQDDITRFRSAVISLEPGMELKGVYAPRRDGELAYQQIYVEGEKSVAQKATLVLYSREKLVDAGQDRIIAQGRLALKGKAAYYVVSINAQPDLEDEPIPPATMLRNMMGQPGGSKPQEDYTAAQILESLDYWRCHALVAPPKKRSE